MLINEAKLPYLVSKACYCLLMILVSVLMLSCQTTPSDTTKLNVDRNIPPSEAFDASYGFWGPNGSTIYFQHSEELSSTPDPGLLDQLWRLNLKTGERKMVHTGRILYADISSDGQWFIFNSFGVPQYLYKMRENGTDLQKLTGPNSPNPKLEYTIQGKWSPDGSQILFSLSAGVPRGISIMKSNGASSHIIVPFGIEPNWSSNGNRITYINWDTSKVRSKQEQIYIANANGSNPKQVTNLKNTLFNIHAPSFSPTGQKIVFIYNGEVHVTKVNNSDAEQITAGPGYTVRPEWSPDGKTILFSRIIPNVSERLYYLDISTLEVTPVFPAKKQQRQLNL